jgi:chorismate mutase
MFSLISSPSLPINRPRSAAGRSSDATFEITEPEMSETGEGDAQALARLRDRIDAVDAEMHRLLIERGTVIDSLIRTKGAGRPGAAFRPGREADMMRRLVARHRGALPLATVEHIWREIITTFTHMQAPFDVAVDTSVEPERVRDLARFVFGFSVELKPVAGPEAVVASVAGAGSLGLIARAAKGAWWRGMVGADVPRIMALLPFIGADGRPADLPAFVISPPLADPTPPDIAVFAVTAAGAMPRVEGVEILAASGDDTLLAVSQSLGTAGLSRRLMQAGLATSAIAPVGGFARGIAVGGPSTLLYETYA